MSLERTLARIEEEKLNLAKGLCIHPADTYEKYMLVVGQYAGLDRARQILLNESARDERGKDEDHDA